MTEPKYRFVNTFEIRNFHENFTAVEIPLIHEGFEWLLKVYAQTENEQKILKTGIQFKDFGKDFRMGLHYSIQFVNHFNPNEPKTDRKIIAKRDQIAHGDSKFMSQLAKDGYLRNRTLKIRVDFQPESLIRVGQFSRFEFGNLFFDHPKKGHNLVLHLQTEDPLLCCHRQMIELHSGAVSESCKEIPGNHVLTLDGYNDYKHLEICLQTMHGVPFSSIYKTEDINILDCLFTAKAFGMHNVIKFLEREIIQNKKARSDCSDLFYMAICFKMERLLKIQLSKKKSIKSFKPILVKYANKPEISSEAMKSFIETFMSID